MLRFCGLLPSPILLELTTIFGLLDLAVHFEAFIIVFVLVSVAAISVPEASVVVSQFIAEVIMIVSEISVVLPSFAAEVIVTVPEVAGVFISYAMVLAVSGCGRLLIPLLAVITVLGVQGTSVGLGW